MATDMIDLASVGLGEGSGSGTGTEVSTPEVTETPAAGAETTETPVTGAEDEELNEDGTPQTAAQKAEATKAATAGTATPQSIRTALKNMRDGVQDPNSPEGKAVLDAVKKLHGNFERYEAIKQAMPGGVAEVLKTQAFLREISGDPKGNLQTAQDAWVRNQELATSIHDSDQLLYSGDSHLIENIVADLKSEGKIAALGQLAPAFLDALKQEDSAGYYKSFAPHFLEGLRTAGVPESVNGIWRALQAGNIEEAKGLVRGIGKWFTELDQRTEASKTDPLQAERDALAKEKMDFEKGKATETGNGIARAADKENNTLLGADLKHFLGMPFFKGFSRENLTPLANQIKSDLFGELKANATYQTHMKSLWLKPKENSTKIAEYHKQTVQGMSARIVRDAVQRMYPGYAKGGSAAGRVANAAAAKASGAAATARSIATGKPVYIAQKPAWDALNMDHKDSNGKDDAQLLFIAGKGYMKGTGRFVTWRK
jgi:hypothetical protein